MWLARSGLHDQTHKAHVSVSGLQELITAARSHRVCTEISTALLKPYCSMKLIMVKGYMGLTGHLKDYSKEELILTSVG